MKQIRFSMGADMERRFWNMASVSEEEGEITLYGDVVSRRPVDWWTGEPEPGLYITPEGFLEDLELVKDKARIVVKLNSGGGDLYTGIAIHNALKALSGEVNVIVEGLAASAASVIMCAGNTVTVYPGSMVMIHGVRMRSFGSLNLQEAEKIVAAMDANEKAVAEIYSEKTGLGVDELRTMMTEEKWMTGREAVEAGFADTLKEDEKEMKMSISQDRKVMYVNGISHSVEGFCNIPKSIPVGTMALPAQPRAYKNPAVKVGTGKGGTLMEEKDLREAYPELVAEIEQKAREAGRAEAQKTAAAEERVRIRAIDSIAASVPDPQMVQDAKYGENPCTAQELCFRVMQASAGSAKAFLENYAKDGIASGTDSVGARPNNGVPVTGEEEDLADIQAVMTAYNSAKGGK